MFLIFKPQFNHSYYSCPESKCTTFLATASAIDTLWPSLVANVSRLATGFEWSYCIDYTILETYSSNSIKTPIVASLKCLSCLVNVIPQIKPYLQKNTSNHYTTYFFGGHRFSIIIEYDSAAYLNLLAQIHFGLINQLMGLASLDEMGRYQWCSGYP